MIPPYTRSKYNRKHLYNIDCENMVRKSNTEQRSATFKKQKTRQT